MIFCKTYIFLAMCGSVRELIQTDFSFRNLVKVESWNKICSQHFFCSNNSAKISFSVFKHFMHTTMKSHLHSLTPRNSLWSYFLRFSINFKYLWENAISNIIFFQLYFLGDITILLHIRFHKRSYIPSIISQNIYCCNVLIFSLLQHI